MSRERSVDVVVVGAGIMGSAAACELAHRGHRVALCEQYQLDHVYGSSHGKSRIFRLAYDEADYVELARQALLGWRELEQELGRELLTTTGGYDVGPPELVAPVKSALDQSGVRSEKLTQADLAGRFETMTVPDGWEVLYQPDAGVLKAKVALETFVELARSRGVEVLGGTRALAIMDEGDHVDVETDDGTIAGEVVVVTAGGWASSLLEPLDLAVPIRVTREHVAYYHVLEGRPMFPFIWHTAGGEPQFYGLPNASPTIAKVGHHLAGEEVHAGSRGAPDPGRIAVITDFVRDYLSGLEPRPILSETCLYASTPDDDFVLDRTGRTVVGIGFGGHGFKFAPHIGALLADLAEGLTIPFSGRFSRSRFAGVVGAR